MKKAKLPPVRPAAPVQAKYRRALQRLVAEMQASYVYWLRAAYRRDTPVMAMDATPAAELAKVLKALFARWEKRFDDGAKELAAHFAKSAAERSDAQLRAILRRAGFSVRFQMTRAMRDVLRSTVEANVSLIKSIPRQYHTEVEGLVMRSVQTGRDLEQLTKDLKARYPITLRRAKLIAIDQNNKATASLTRARQLDLGLEEGIWQHSGAGKEPRRTHVANNEKRFSIKEGWFDPDPKVRERIWPGQLINCRCSWRPVVKGFS